MTIRHYKNYDKVGMFERVWWATLGVPQQLSRRYWRVATGRAKWYSSSGFMDAALLPIIGIGVGPGRHVTDYEIFGHLGPAGQAAASIASDPLTYFTGGASAVARTAIAGRKGLKAAGILTELPGPMRGAIKNPARTGGMTPRSSWTKEARGVAPQAEVFGLAKAGEARELLEHALKTGKTVTGGLLNKRGLKQVAKAAEEFGTRNADELIGDIMYKSNEKAMYLSFLMGFGGSAFNKEVPRWFKGTAQALGQPVRFSAKGYARTGEYVGHLWGLAGKQVSHIPAMKRAHDIVGDLASIPKAILAGMGNQYQAAVRIHAARGEQLSRMPPEVLLPILGGSAHGAQAFPTNGVLHNLRERSKIAFNSEGLREVSPLGALIDSNPVWSAINDLEKGSGKRWLDKIMVKPKSRALTQNQRDQVWNDIILGKKRWTDRSAKKRYVASPDYVRAELSAALEQMGPVHGSDLGKSVRHEIIEELDELRPLTPEDIAAGHKEPYAKKIKVLGYEYREAPTTHMSRLTSDMNRLKESDRILTDALKRKGKPLDSEEILTVLKQNNLEGAYKPVTHLNVVNLEGIAELVPERGWGISKFAAKHASAFRKVLGSKFRGGGGTASFEELVSSTRALRNMHQVRIALYGPKIHTLYRNIGREMGMTPGEVSEAFSLASGVVPHENEIQALGGFIADINNMNAGLNVDDLVAWSNHIDEYIEGRLIGTANEMKEMVGDGSNAYLKSLSDKILGTTVNPNPGPMGAVRESLDTYSALRVPTEGENILAGTLWGDLFESAAEIRLLKEKALNETVSRPELGEAFSKLRQQLRSVQDVLAAPIITGSGVVDENHKLLAELFASLSDENARMSSHFDILFGTARPIGYVPRLLTTSEARELTDYMGELESSAGSRKERFLISSLNAAVKRKQGRLTINQLDMLVTRLRQVNPNVAALDKIITKLHSAQPEVLNKYAHDNFVAVLSNLSHMHEIKSLEGLIDTVRADGTAKLISGQGTDVQFGRIVGIFDNVEEIDVNQLGISIGKRARKDVPAPSSTDFNRTRSTLRDQAYLDEFPTLKDSPKEFREPMEKFLAKHGSEAPGEANTWVYLGELPSRGSVRRFAYMHPVTGAQMGLDSKGRALVRAKGKKPLWVLDKSKKSTYEWHWRAAGGQSGVKRIAVVGSRQLATYTKVSEFVKQLPEDRVIVSGGAKGVDSIAESSARGRGMESVVHKPDWKTHGKSAAFLRNQTIVDDSDELVAFWDGKSKGTKHTIDLARKKGIPFRVFSPEGKLIMSNGGERSPRGAAPTVARLASPDPRTTAALIRGAVKDASITGALKDLSPRAARIADRLTSHEKNIQEALDAGLSINPRVLDDYPDLKKRLEEALEEGDDGMLSMIEEEVATLKKVPTPSDEPIIFYMAKDSAGKEVLHTWRGRSSSDVGMHLSPLGIGKTPGKAAARTAALGDKPFASGGTVINTEQAKLALLEAGSKDQGLWATISHESVLSSLDDILKHDSMASGYFTRAMDSMTRLMKMGVTSADADFHMRNAASVMPLLYGDGVSFWNIFMGMVETTQLLYRPLPDLPGTYGRMSKLHRDSGFRVPFFEKIHRLFDLSVELQDRTIIEAMEHAEKNLPGMAVDDAYRTYKGERLSWRQWLEPLVTSGLIRTFQATEVAGKHTLKSAEKAIRHGEGKTIAGRMFHKFQAGAEFSELFSRLWAYNAYQRQGLDRFSAAQAAKTVLVDYDNLSKFERATMRRHVPFYTWSRRTTPEFVKQASANPDRYGRGMHVFFGLESELDKEKSGDLSRMGLGFILGGPLGALAGLAWDDVGLPTLRTETAYGTPGLWVNRVRLNLGQVVPQADLLSAITWGADMWQAPTNKVVPLVKLGGEAPGFMQPHFVYKFALDAIHSPFKGRQPDEMDMSPMSRMMDDFLNTTIGFRQLSEFKDRVTDSWQPNPAYRTYYDRWKEDSFTIAGSLWGGSDRAIVQQALYEESNMRAVARMYKQRLQDPELSREDRAEFTENLETMLKRYKKSVAVRQQAYRQMARPK